MLLQCLLWFTPLHDPVTAAERRGTELLVDVLNQRCWPGTSRDIRVMSAPVDDMDAIEVFAQGGFRNIENTDPVARIGQLVPEGFPLDVPAQEFSRLIGA